jgi:hypothetical protein
MGKTFIGLRGFWGRFFEDFSTSRTVQSTDKAGQDGAEGKKSGARLNGRECRAPLEITLKEGMKKTFLLQTM